MKMLVLLISVLLVITLLIAILVTTYVWSSNPDHRLRSREMLLVLLASINPQVAPSDIVSSTTDNECA
ncbi:hypothetical protein [Micromonospora sp. CPCC 206061]|uniref:hypothetical protein n=1 Tax=Micromonospora sp. CPCC 206061 TaxID=3122410 RepID=UPI002FF1C0FF